MLSKIAPYALILIASIIISLPLTVSGLFKIHDDQQVARLYLFDKSLKEGQFPVRWVDELGFGYGYPLFNFYPPLVYLFGEVFHLIGFSFIDSVKLVFFFSIFLSGVGMYVLIKEIWGKFAGLTAALFYMVLPYRALDIYVRGALAEAFSFVWTPFILWSFYKLSNLQEQSDYKLSNLQERSDYKLNKLKTQRYIFSSAVFLALLMITHNLIFLPFMLILPIYLIFLFLKTSEKRLFTINCLLSIIFALGLSAFFWLPAIFEKRFTLVDQLLLTKLADFKIHFVYLQQLWNWTWGFGGSAAGLTDGISFKIGKIHILVSIAALTIAISNLVSKPKRDKFTVLSSQFAVIFFLLFIFAAFMTTYYSKFLWEIIKPLEYLQFPWRFLILTGLFSSALAGALIFLLRVTIFRLLACFLLIILLLLPNLKLFKPQNYRLDLTDEKATSYDVIARDVSKTSFEYIPKGVPLLRDEMGYPKADLNLSEIPMAKIEVNPAVAKISNLEYSSTMIDFNLEAFENTSVRANIFSFPGWKVEVDRKSVPINNNNRLKLITFDVPSGVHEITVRFSNTEVRNLANFVTFVSLIFLIYYFARLWQIHEKN